jgi:hypothetical protein
MKSWKKKKKVKNKSTTSGPPDFILAADIYLAKCFWVIKPEMDTSIIFAQS